MARILVVDNDSKACTPLVDLLKYEGHVVIECNNGADGLRAVERERPDLVISDPRMPGMSGTQFLAELREQSQHPHTPVIFHTAAGDDREIRELATADGVKGILAKPCPAGVILAEITSALKPLLREPVPAPLDRLRARIPAYVASCDADVAAIELALAVDDLVSIRNVGHDLKGTGSAYGFCHITHIGDLLESAAMAGNRTEIAEQVKDLASYLGAIKATSTEIAYRTEGCARCMTGDKDH